LVISSSEWDILSVMKYFSPLVFLVAGCVHLVNEDMQDAALPLALQSNEALVVVFRPSSFGGNTQFPIFEFTGEDAKLLGFSESGCYFEVRVAAGRHLFLTWGEGEAYIEADLSAGRTYYIRCFAKLGVLAPRPRFAPVRRDSEEWKNLDLELKDLKRRELKPSVAQVDEKSREERARSAKKSLEEGRLQPTYLKPDDGR
jgi:hypothetical protein